MVATHHDRSRYGRYQSKSLGCARGAYLQACREQPKQSTLKTYSALMYIQSAIPSAVTARRWHVDSWLIRVTVRCIRKGPESWRALLVQTFLPDSRPGQWACVDLGLIVTQAADILLLRKAISKATAAWWQHRTSPFTRLEHMRFKIARVTLPGRDESEYSQVHLMELAPAIEQFVHEHEGRLMDTDFCFYTVRTFECW